MPLCRSCNGTFAREYFIHGNGPRAQVCVRCGLDQGLVTKEEVPTFFDDGLISSRLSVVSRRWGPAITLIMGWTFWLTFLTGVSPWGTYVLVLLGIGTLLLPAQILLYRAKYSGDMARLTPNHERPKGH
ncbi:MAG TPA: hypothetical protein HA276_07330 [Candidatus Poseidoniaceae archaeon]|nr:MAG TPA: hypothetical protein D7I01_07215 [Candidatus Poseidoniales archaeon]HII97486.1 hypothetical protein [Candidatus Poseidoniaceae archaeon]|tara:strand:+ start:3439 stop:3825 length:387 start_codon:yes stop_codon:yes gene_type:complete